MSNTKYELIDDPSGLKRIKALVDIPRQGVRAGNLGGLIGAERNLAVSGDARVSGAAWVSGAAQVSRPEHVLGIAANPTPNAESATLTRQKDGTHLLAVGCWRGTTDALRTLAHSDSWPSGQGADYRDRYRPTLLAIADLCDTRIALWEPSDATEAEAVSA